MRRNSLLVVNGGAPTAVLNATLYGILAEAQGRYEHVLGAHGGTAGALTEDFIELQDLADSVRQALPHTPGTVIGTSRTPLLDDDLDRLVEVCHRHAISGVLFGGGNGTMDTCSRFREAIRRSDQGPISVVGVPKTIDNDLPATDHAPGFGSAARYLAATTAEITADVRSLPIHVCIIEAMGRNAGWLTAASALARRYGGGPDLVYLPERAFDPAAFLDRVQNLWDDQGYAVVVVSEGLALSSGQPVVPPLMSTGRSVYFGEVGAHLSQLIVTELGIKARSEKPGIAGRASMAWQSTIDRQEAELVGRAAVMAIVDGRDGVMMSIQREPGASYATTVQPVDLAHLALSEKTVPAEYISPDSADVTDDYVDWLEPLVGPLPSFATL